MSEVTRKVIHWLVEAVSKCETREIWRELIHWLVEFSSKGKIGEMGWKIDERGVECGSYMEKN